MDRQRHRLASAPLSRQPEPAALAGGSWRLDPKRSRVGFEVPHLWGLGTVRGSFASLGGSLDLRRRPAAMLTIAADSLDTGNPRRDRHLRSPDFLDVARHPYVRFQSTSVTPTDEGLSVIGLLTARGRQLEVELDVAIAAVDDELELDAEVFVMHRGLGITWNPTGFTRPYSKLTFQGHLTPMALVSPVSLFAPASFVRPRQARPPVRQRGDGPAQPAPRCRRA